MFPVDAHSSPSSPSSRAIVVATATGRSLNEHVGLTVSFFSQTEPARSSGVPPSPSVVGSPRFGSSGP